MLSRRAKPRHARPPFPSDMTDAEWEMCEPLLPAPAWLAGKGGRPAVYCMRGIVDGIAT